MRVLYSPDRFKSCGLFLSHRILNKTAKKNFQVGGGNHSLTVKEKELHYDDMRQRQARAV